jgi:cytochrome P450
MRTLGSLPGPRGWPVLGNLPQIKSTRLHLQLENWAQEFGPFFRLKLGPRHVLVVADHQATASVLRDRPDGFRRTERLQEIGLEMGIQPGLFGVNGEMWKRQRRMVMAGFDPAHVRRYHPALAKVAGRLQTRWTLAAQQEQTIDLQADLMRFTVDAIAGLAFGAEVKTLDSDDDVIQRHLDKIFPTLFKRMLSPLPVWRWWRTPAVRALERSMAEVNLAVDGFIQQARQRLVANPALRQRPGNLLEAMIVAADEEDSGMDDAQVAGNVLTMLLAGEDTTANTLAWMIDLLWQHPAALARATSEVRGLLDNAAASADSATSACAVPALPLLRPLDQSLNQSLDQSSDQSLERSLELSLEQLGELHFIEACAHETMRLRPVAPIIAVQALRDVVVGDVQVLAGTVLINVMRHESVSDAHLPRALQFEPERWLADGGSQGQLQAQAQASAAKRVSMPFGAGPRICPGRYLALLEMKMAMCTLLGHFDILEVSTADGMPAQERLQLAMMPVGLRMRLKARAPAVPAPASASALA